MNALFENCGLKCLSCDHAEWNTGSDALNCRVCQTSYAIVDGVLLLKKPEARDDVTRLYSAMNGTHFVNVSFQNNPLIYITTRAYRNFLEATFPTATGNLLDFACGDGRLSLWAAEKGFAPVVAVDSNLPSLKRLAAEASRRKLHGVVTICADLKNPPFLEGYFGAVLCIEVLYYLVPSLGRKATLETPAKLLSAIGTMVLSEFSRFGRAIIDLDAMDITNARSLVDSSERWEKFADTRNRSFQWGVADLRRDLAAAGLRVRAETGISLAAALFSYAWNLTTYPLRPPLDDNLRTILEAVCDNTAGAKDDARNVVFALEKIN